MYPRFAAALLELGDDHDARGEALEVSGRTIARYLDGDLPEPLVKLMRQPHLLRALAEDAERLSAPDKLVISAA